MTPQRTTTRSLSVPLSLAARALPLVLAALSGCRGGGTDEGSGGSGGGGATGALSCPRPGKLPFETERQDFETEEGGSVAAQPRIKDEASDILGNPGGGYTFTDMPVDAAPAMGTYKLNGRKARTQNSSGLVAAGVPLEAVSFWARAGASWENLGRLNTDQEGRYRLDVASDSLSQVVYSVLEGDGSCAEHHSYLLPPGTKVLVTDIDGTLTISDDELFAQINDGSYDPKENRSASQLMDAWAKKGYQVVYLTARPHMFRAETRTWLAKHGFPAGPVISANQLVFGDSARTYKRAWVERIRSTLGWDIVAAYGNADSDIDAYEDGGIPKQITFIIGEYAGQSGTVAIQDNDYTAHISDFVASQPTL